mmetsp:Transcript_10843/g.33253  ORF Transcript_10843/g.33253 Transcript_10843/m.33253 type:complete len:122 (+) Transcript_10843:86-451(+)
MGLLEDPPVVIYYLSQEDKRDPYKKVGPYTMSTLAQMYKEEVVNDSTVIWTNEKLKMRGKIRRQKVPGWNPIRDMPEEWQRLFRFELNKVVDRRQTYEEQNYSQMQMPAGTPMEQPPNAPY